MLLCSVPLTELVVVVAEEELGSSTFLMALRCQYQAITLPGLITETEPLEGLDLTVDQMVQQQDSFVVRYLMLLGHW